MTRRCGVDAPDFAQYDGVKSVPDDEKRAIPLRERYGYEPLLAESFDGDSGACGQSHERGSDHYGG